MPLLHIILVYFVFVLIGLPFVALAGRTKLKEPSSQLLFQAFAVGIAVTTLIFQGVVRLSLPFKSVALFWAIAGLTAGIGMLARMKVLRIRRRAYSAFAVSLVLAAGLGLLPALSQDSAYYGRAWGDQLNYSLLANYFVQSPVEQSIGRPDLDIVTQGGLLVDRIGQSILHAFITVLLPNQDAARTFYYCSAMSVLLWFGGAFCAAVRLGCTHKEAMGAAFLIALSPALHVVHLESFLSQALVGGFLLHLLLAAGEIEAGTMMSSTFRLSLILGFVLAAYFEYFPIYLALALVCSVIRYWLDPKDRWRPLVGVVAAAALGLLWNGPWAYNSFLLMERLVIVRDLGKFFPWAFEYEGASRLFLGDYAARLTAGQNMTMAIVVLAATSLFLRQIWIVFRERSLPESAAILLAALLPLAVAVSMPERSYQFYKVLQSVWALCLLGFPLLLRSRTLNARRAMSCLLVLMLGTSTVSMLFAETSKGKGSSRSGMNSYLYDNSGSALKELLAPVGTGELYVMNPAVSHYNDGLANGWFLLFAGQIVDRLQTQLPNVGDRGLAASSVNPELADPGNPSLRPPSAEFLANLREGWVAQLGATFVRPAPSLFELAGQTGRILLFRPKSDQWIFVWRIYQKDQTAFEAIDRSVTVRSRPENYLRLDFQSAEAKENGLELRLKTGKGEGALCWHIYTNMPYGNTVCSSASEAVIPTGPIRKGITRVFFGPITPGDDPVHPKVDATATIRSLEYDINARVQ